MVTDLTPYFQQAEQYLVQYGNVKSWRIDLKQVTERIREYCSGGITWDSSAGETWASINFELKMIAVVLSTLPLVILTKEFVGAVEPLDQSNLSKSRFLRKGV